MSRLCPVCPDQPLEGYAFQAIQVDICPACAGVWVDEGESKALLTQEPEAVADLESKFARVIQPAPAGSRLRLCPDCRLPLDRFQYLYNGPVDLDHCHACGGLWVDDGELVKMKLVKEAGSAFRSPQEQREWEAKVRADANPGLHQHLQDAWETLRAILLSPPWRGA